MRNIFPVRFLYLGFISLLLAMSLCVPGCKNPFKTRSSPQPVFTEGTWETPAIPEIVIRNLLHAYNERIIGNFNLCISDSFRFSAPQDSIDAVIQGRADLFSHWDRSVEISVTTNIFNTSRQNPDSFSYVLSFHLIPPVSDDIGETLAVLSRDYELLVSDLKAVPAETTLTGTATFYMMQTSLSWWSIYLWKDIPEKKDGWADFKAKFRQ